MRRAVILALVATLAGGGAALAEPGPNGHNNHGLCKAYFSGSDKGQANKRQAPPFRELEAQAAAANQTVAEFCAAATPGGK